MVKAPGAFSSEPRTRAAKARALKAQAIPQPPPTDPTPTIQLSDEEEVLEVEWKKVNLMRRREWMNKKNPLVELGVDLETDAVAQIWREVAEGKEWVRLLQPVDCMALDIVREFYAAVHPQSHYVTVRGVRVDYDSVNINHHLDLPDHEDALGNQVMIDPTTEQLQEALELVGTPEANWDFTSVGSQRLGSRDISVAAALWIYVVKNRIMPTEHDQKVSRDRVLLVYAMMKGFPINFGRIIRDVIHTSARREKGKLFFPGLITSLCIGQGVRVPESQIERKYPKIQERNLKRLLGSALAREEARGASPSAEVRALRTTVQRLELHLETMIDYSRRLHERLQEFMEPPPWPAAFVPSSASSSRVPPFDPDRPAN